MRTFVRPLAVVLAVFGLSAFGASAAQAGGHGYGSSYKKIIKEYELEDNDVYFHHNKFLKKETEIEDSFNTQVNYDIWYVKVD